MNQLHLTGHLGRDAELKEVAGTDLLEFSVAMTTGFGENKETEWVSCALWGKRARPLQQYLVKGQLVAVCGSIKTNAFMRSKGLSEPAPGAEIVLRVAEVTLLGSREDREQSLPQSGRASAPAAGAGIPDDVPF